VTAGMINWVTSGPNQTTLPKGLGPLMWDETNTAAHRALLSAACQSSPWWGPPNPQAQGGQAGGTARGKEHGSNQALSTYILSSQPPREHQQLARHSPQHPSVVAAALDCLHSGWTATGGEEMYLHVLCPAQHLKQNKPLVINCRTTDDPINISWALTTRPARLSVGKRLNSSVSSRWADEYHCSSYTSYKCVKMKQNDRKQQHRGGSAKYGPNAKSSPSQKTFASPW
jgi:hypothetical protein